MITDCFSRQFSWIEKDFKMKDFKHQWATFKKGHIRIRACASCGELHLPSNAEQACGSNHVFDSQIVKAGYRLHTERSYFSEPS